MPAYSTKNAVKAPNKVENWLFIHLKNYLIQYHDYPSEKYVAEYIINLKKDLVRIFEQIIGFGVVFYLCLLGTILTVPNVSNYLDIFWSYYTIFLVLLLGLIAFTVKQIYGGMKR